MTFTTTHTTDTANTLTAELIQMLSYRRPARSKTEEEFIERFIMPMFELPTVHSAGTDTYGNVWIETSPDSTTMFTAHTDSVHHTEGRQVLAVDDKHRIVLAADEQQSSCLGADDAAGIFVLIQMIRAGVPGTYYFFRDEEIGGKGSRWLAEQEKAWVGEFARVVSFDRRGTSSVITHQAADRCCSDTFAEALSDALCSDALMYAPDDTGVFTDSANFTHIVSECTNISVGYQSEHTKSESQDVQHILDLATQCCVVDWESLPTERDPAKPDPLRYGWGSAYRKHEYAAYDEYFTRFPEIQTLTVQDIEDMDYNDLVDLIDMSDPMQTAELIVELAWQAKRTH